MIKSREQEEGESGLVMLRAIITFSDLDIKRKETLKKSCQIKFFFFPLLKLLNISSVSHLHYESMWGAGDSGQSILESIHRKASA